MVAILGSGFGLYGYLPALIESCSKRIVLPERYRSRFYNRTELERYANYVFWEENELKVLDRSRGVVLALHPIKQSEWIPKCLARPNIERLLLEKPLAPSPELALRLYGDLLRSRKVFRIGYNFRYTEWGKKLLVTPIIRSNNGLLTIQWCFSAHHFRYNPRSWKRFTSDGGGAIRFYGIHIIALLSEIGYQNVISSSAYGSHPNEIEKWVATFKGSNLPKCEVFVDTVSSINQFRIEHSPSTDNVSDTTSFVQLTDPFDLRNSRLSGSNQIDRRIPILCQLCRSFWGQEEGEYKWYEATLNLWISVEEKTQFERVSSDTFISRPGKI